MKKFSIAPYQGALAAKKPISELSANLFRFRKGLTENKLNGLIKLDKRSFDLMHFSTAKCSHCECVSRDNDISKIEKIHLELNQ